MKELVVAEIKIIPLGTPTTSLSWYVAACIDILKQEKDIKYQITAMATHVQGPLERVLEIYQKMHEIPFKMGAKRVLTSITIDDRRDKAITIESKIKAVTK
jgi:uncharacterized protein (TIGR00106 family)